MFKPHIFTLIVFFVTVIDVCVLCIELYVHLKKTTANHVFPLQDFLFFRDDKFTEY